MATVTAVYGVDRNIRDVNDIIKYETENLRKESSETETTDCKR